MNLRWLLGNYVDPQYPMSRRVQFRLSITAHQKYVTYRVFWMYTTIVLVPMIAAQACLHPLLSAFGYGGQNQPYFIALAILILLFWVWSAWMYRSMYVRPIRRALRDTGLDLCIHCGYDLRGLPPDAVPCPECGAKREPMPESSMNAERSP